MLNKTGSMALDKPGVTGRCVRIIAAQSESRKALLFQLVIATAQAQ